MTSTYTISAIVMTDARPELVWTGETFRDERWEPEYFDSEADARDELDRMDAAFLFRHGFAAGNVKIRIESASDGPVKIIAEKLVEVADIVATMIAALSDIAEVHYWDGRGHILHYTPDSSLPEYDGNTEPGSAWDEECDYRLAEVRDALPAGWVADWSDDDIIIDLESD